MAEKFRFKKRETIGASAAEQDERFLARCFVDTGDLDVLLDPKDPRRIVLGRTGAGKTALLHRLSTEPRTVTIQPENLSFNFLSNSTILKFFLEAGVKLDLFFRLLWRHVFAVELLKERYGIRDSEEKKSVLAVLRGLIGRDQAKKRALDYLEKWGTQFWKETEYRVEEVTKKVEGSLGSCLEGDLKFAKLDATAAMTLSTEQRAEIQRRGQDVINGLQMRELSEILALLDEHVFDDDQKPYYIIIDRLDENWVDDRLRYLLIRSLIETARDFFRVHNVKIVVALRTDLLERVFRHTRDPGFQEEKYRDLYLTLRWNQERLIDVVEQRVSFLIRSAYTNSTVKLKDLLPHRIGQQDPYAYLVSLTMKRPRDLIEFFNAAMEQAEGDPTITASKFQKAETKYSQQRLRSLQDEWISDFPYLIIFTRLLRGKKDHFMAGDFERTEIESFCLEYAVERPDAKDELSHEARRVAEAVSGYWGFVSILLRTLHRTGVVALKLESYAEYHWAYETDASIIPDAVGTETRVKVHPMFHQALGIRR